MVALARMKIVMMNMNLLRRRTYSLPAVAAYVCAKIPLLRTKLAAAVAQSNAVFKSSED